MTIKKFKNIDKKGRESTWEWEETPEVIAALERLHSDYRKVSQNDNLEKFSLGDK
tara:strand:- start:225 stop:389 length:165 start_codon:yes stop_codon:yes gene_type:complete